MGGGRTGAGVRGAAPLADDLGVGLHQVVRNVSARQVLQGVCGAELLLHKHKGETVSSSQPPTKLPPGVKGSKVRGRVSGGRVWGRVRGVEVWGSRV